MKNPLIIVALMLTACVVVTGIVVVLGNHAANDVRDTTKGLKVPASFPRQDLKSETTTILTDLPVASKTGPWPKIAFDEATYAFGRMAVNAKNQHTFVIRNEGEADLIMKAGQTDLQMHDIYGGIQSAETWRRDETGDRLEGWRGA